MEFIVKHKERIVAALQLTLALLGVIFYLKNLNKNQYADAKKLSKLETKQKAKLMKMQYKNDKKALKKNFKAQRAVA